jgi:hypothetical protein
MPHYSAPLAAIADADGHATAASSSDEDGDRGRKALGGAMRRPHSMAALAAGGLPASADAARSAASRVCCIASTGAVLRRHRSCHLCLWAACCCAALVSVTHTVRHAGPKWTPFFLH